MANVLVEEQSLSDIANAIRVKSQESSGVFPYIQREEFEDYKATIEAEKLNVYGKGVNLLDNWYFVNPVNQRGGYVVPPGTLYYDNSDPPQNIGTTADGTYYPVLSYYQTAELNGWSTFSIDGTVYQTPSFRVVPGYADAGYTIDRWVSLDGHITVLIEGNGLRIVNSGTAVGYFESRFEQDITGKQMCLSFLVNDVLYFGSGVAKKDFQYQESISGVGDDESFTAALLWDGVNYYVVIAIQPGKSINVQAVKLELGDTQTLAHQDADGNWVLNDPPPNFQQELAKCQRYYQVYATQSLRPSNAADCRPVMRTTPVQSTITIDGTTFYVNNAEL